MFKLTLPLFECLQTSGLDILQSWRMVDATTKKLDLPKRYFQTILEKVSKFVEAVNEKSKSLDIFFSVEENLSKKAIFITSYEKLKVNVYNVMLDKTLYEYKKESFQNHCELGKNFACLHPNR